MNAIAEKKHHTKTQRHKRKTYKYHFIFNFVSSCLRVKNSQIINDEELLLAALSMDLQWFAAEDEGRTYDPTEATYRREREKGKVAKSQEFVSALGLLLPAIAIIILAPYMLRTCTEMLSFFFTRINELDPLNDRFTAGIFAIYFVRLALPILVVAVITALFSNLVQIGFLFSTKPLEMDFSKVLPKFGQYFGRIFSVEGLFNFGKSIFKMAVIGTVAFFIVRSKFNELANLQTVEFWMGVSLVASLAAQLLVITAFLLLFLSIPDIFFQRWQFRESIKMTRDVFKEELKQDMGDQEVRRKLRHRYREMLSQNLQAVVPNADVVITNPTHYSVALEYDNERMEAPTVIAKGEDDLAMRIREIAKANNVPLVSRPPLARALYQTTEVGDFIPAWCFTAVAVILKQFYNYELVQEKIRRREKSA